MSIDIDLLNVNAESDSRIIHASVTGQLQEQDYQLLTVQVEQLLQRHASLRMLAQLTAFEGWSPGAAWEDAKLGYRHFSDFERLAVVGDKRWEEWMVRLSKPFTLADTRFFEPTELDKALAWIAEPAHAEIRISVEEERRVVRVRPRGRLSKTDFLQLAREIDPLIERWGALSGLVIESRDFPGWESIGALIRHLHFVSDHHENIRRIALVTDSPLGTIAEHVAGHFVAARIKQFDPEDIDIALDWAAKIDGVTEQ